MEVLVDGSAVASGLGNSERIAAEAVASFVAVNVSFLGSDVSASCVGTLEDSWGVGAVDDLLGSGCGDDTSGRSWSWDSFRIFVGLSSASMLEFSVSAGIPIRWGDALVTIYCDR